MDNIFITLVKAEYLKHGLMHMLLQRSISSKKCSSLEAKFQETIYENILQCLQGSFITEQE